LPIGNSLRLWRALVTSRPRPPTAHAVYTSCIHGHGTSVAAFEIRQIRTQPRPIARVGDRSHYPHGSLWGLSSRAQRYRGPKRGAAARGGLRLVGLLGADLGAALQLSHCT